MAVKLVAVLVVVVVGDEAGIILIIIVPSKVNYLKDNSLYRHQ